MKRIILSLLLTVIAVAGWGQLTIDKINYVVTGANTCSVAEFMPERGEEVDFVVPSSISYINAAYTVEGINKLACFNAMMSGGSIKSITLPNTLRYIKEGAFVGSNITSIVIPEGVTTLGMYAFAHCPNLKHVTIPSTLTTIEACDNASFYGPNTTSFSEGNFINNSRHLTSEIAEQLGIKFNGEEPEPETRNVTIDKIVYDLYDNNTCAVIGAEPDLIGDIVVPSTINYDNVTYDVKSILEHAFIGTNCTSIVVSEGITSIIQNAFLGCPKLTSVTLPSSLTEIVRSGNYYINVKPSCLTPDKFINNSSIPNDEAAGMSGIYLCDVITDDGLAIKDNNVDFYLYHGSNLSVNIPEGVTGVSSSLLSGNYIFTAITIPSTFTINSPSYPSGMSYVLRSGFVNNSNVPDEQVAEYLGVLLADEITADGFIIDNHVLVGYVGSNEPGLSITIPEGITAISPILTWTNLETIVIPESVTGLSSNSFANCTFLKNVTIKGQNVDIPSYAFENCKAIQSFTIYAITPPEIDAYSTFNTSIFYNNATLYVPFTSVNAYKTAPGWGNFKNIVGVETPGIHLISSGKVKYALFDNDNTGWVIGTESDIEGDIVIPASIRYDNMDYAITTIMEKAFASTNITSAVVSEGITTIETYAFFGCPNLQSITLPSTLQNVTFEISATNGLPPTPSYINKDNFINNSQVNVEDIWELGINLYDEKTADGLIIDNHYVIGYVGSNEPGLSITIPEGVTTIVSIFTWTNLETVVIPESVTEIRPMAFSSCNSLKNVTIKGQNVDIGRWAFEGCSAIQNFTLYATTPPDVNDKNLFGYNINYINATLHVPLVNVYKSAPEWKNFKNIVGFVPEGYYLHHYFNCKDEELTSDEYAYLTKDDSEKRYVNGDGHEYGSNGMCKHCGEPLKCAKPTYDAENGLRCKTEGVQYEIKSGYWIATSPEMPTDISLTIIAKKDGYIDSDPLLITISKYDLNNDGKLDLNDLKYLQDKVLEK